MTRKGRRTSGGIELTEELIEKLADEAERGYDVERLAKRGRGRPPLGSSAATTFQVRLDPELRRALEERADAEETTPSAVARRALREHLRLDPRNGSSRPPA
ncbi:MAG: CopG family transcriptional regulator [Candidatus Binatia bacterium]